MPGRSLDLEARPYVVSRGLVLTGARMFKINALGAALKAADGMPVAADYQILKFIGCTDGIVSDLAVDGNRARRKPAEVPAHSVQIYTGCARLVLTRIKSNDAVVDGFYIGTATPRDLASLPTDIQFHNCSADNAYRNGGSLINSNRFRDYDGVYTNANGTLPMSGFDIEPNSPDDLGNIDARLYRTQANDNSGTGFQVTQRNSTARLYDVVANNNKLGAVNGMWGYLEINGITMDGYGKTVKRGIIDASYKSGETHISGVVARNCNTGSPSKPLIYIHSSNTSPVTIDGMKTSRSLAPIIGGRHIAVNNLVATP